MAIPIEAYGDDEPRRPHKSAAELQVMSNSELADFIEKGTFDDDGFSYSARIGLVRVLRQLSR